MSHQTTCPLWHEPAKRCSSFGLYTLPEKCMCNNCFYDVYQACERRWTCERVTMLGRILHCKRVTLDRGGLTQTLKLGTTVADGQLCAPVRTPRDCRHRSSSSTDTPSWICIHHCCLCFALLPVGQVVLCLAKEENTVEGSIATQSKEKHRHDKGRK